MCKSCKMNDREIETFYRRQGMVDAEDFDDEPRYRHPKRRRRTNKTKTRPGCPDNNFGPHVPIWTTEFNRTDYLFYKVFGWHKWEKNICAGCGKKMGTRKTERYIKIAERKYRAKYGGPENMPRGEPRSRWGVRRSPPFHYFAWERDNAEYAEALDRYKVQHGFYYDAEWSI